MALRANGQRRWQRSEKDTGGSEGRVGAVGASPPGGVTPPPSVTNSTLLSSLSQEEGNRGTWMVFLASQSFGSKGRFLRSRFPLCFLGLPTCHSRHVLSPGLRDGRLQRGWETMLCSVSSRLRVPVLTCPRKRVSQRFSTAFVLRLWFLCVFPSHTRILTSRIILCRFIVLGVRRSPVE